MEGNNCPCTVDVASEDLGAEALGSDTVIHMTGTCPQEVNGPHTPVPSQYQAPGSHFFLSPSNKTSIDQSNTAKLLCLAKGLWDVAEPTLASDLISHLPLVLSLHRGT